MMTRFSKLPKDVQDRIWKQRADEARVFRNAKRRNRANERKRREESMRPVNTLKT